MDKITIKDVAKKAGVSIATVSRVLNRNEAVNEILAKRVIDAVESLGYYPNTIARTLKGEKTKTIGYVVSDISNTFFTTMARSIEDVLNRHNYSLIVCSTDSDKERETNYLKLLMEKQVDGIIINASGQNDELITSISKSIPVQLFSRKIHNADYIGDFIDNDNTTGLYNLTQHLISLGHKKIGLINGQPYLSSAIERFEGFKKAMATIGTGIDSTYPYIYDGNFNDTASGVEGAMVLKERGATAIITANNILTVGALKYCNDFHVKVPEELSICSFGLVENYDYLFTRPTSVDLSPAAMGSRIGEMMIERIESKNMMQNREVRFPTNMIIGNATRLISG